MYRRSKYNNVRNNGSDSKREERRKRELEMMEQQGMISDLRFQIPFELIPAQYAPDTIGPRGGRIKGKCLERACNYIADFVYEQNGETVIEDSKGFRTHEYIIKRKLMLYRYGIAIKEV